MTISGYIDHILSEHFEQYGAELESLNNRKGHEIVEQITIKADGDVTYYPDDGVQPVDAFLSDTGTRKGAKG